MKKAFRVSNLNPVNDTANVVLISKYLQSHYPNTSKVQILIPTFTSARQLTELARICVQKYEMYTKVLTDRLNLIHNTSHSLKYWQGALSLPFLRQITILYDFYLLMQTNFDPDLYQYAIIKEEDFYVPTLFEDQRSLIQSSMFGNEQIFSMYVRHFYPSLDHAEITYRYETAPRLPQSLPSNFISHKVKSVVKSGASISSTIKSILLELHSYLFKKRVALFGVYFSGDHLKTLLKNRSIIHLGQPRFDYAKSHRIDYDARRELSKPLEHSSDKFDDFFFSTLEHLMPKHLIEDYRSLNSQIKRFFKSTGKLKCVVSEVWLSNSQACVALSYLRERGSIHIYNEHNALFHPFVGGMVDFIAGHCDKYFTIGWTPKKYHTNILRGASLYGFQQNVKEKPNGRILFISGPYQYKMPNYSALYGLCGDYFVTNHVEFLRTFFRSLDAGIKKRIDYRPYPTNYGMDILLYDKEELLKPHLNSCNIIRNFSVKAKALLGKYDLIVIDYISTSLLESLATRCPTVFFHPPNNYFLESPYEDIFEPLKRVGICQTDPEIAATFIEEKAHDVRSWWEADTTQGALNEFLDQNIGLPSEALEYYQKL